MSAPVDVLAVLDRAIESASLMVKASGDMRAVAYQDDLFKARAAVAELIRESEKIEDSVHKLGMTCGTFSTALASVKGA